MKRKATALCSSWDNDICWISVSSTHPFCFLEQFTTIKEEKGKKIKIKRQYRFVNRLYVNAIYSSFWLGLLSINGP